MYNDIVTYYSLILFFFFNDTATTEIYTLSLHDALPILDEGKFINKLDPTGFLLKTYNLDQKITNGTARSEEHTSELQSRQYLVCRLLLEKKKLTTIADNSRC